MTDKQHALYMYGIMECAKDELAGAVPGIEGVYLLSVLPDNDFFVLVSYVDADEYGEEKIHNYLEDMRWVKEKAQRHFAVVQQMARHHIFIPMKFCTIFMHEENLKIFLNKYKEAIKEAFKYFSDKEEWTVKMYCVRNNFIEQNMDEERQAFQSSMANLSPGKAYFLRKNFQLSLEEKSKEKIEKIKQRIWEEIRAVADRTKLNTNLSQQITERREEMVLNAAFLVKKKNLTTLTALADKLDRQLAGLNMYVELAGPWPFYNFTELFIREQKNGS